MYYPWEIAEKIKEAQSNSMDSFSFVDHEGDEVEVHIEKRDQNIIDMFDWMS